jgi:hypothetical protein
LVFGLSNAVLQVVVACVGGQSIVKGVFDRGDVWVCVVGMCLYHEALIDL